MSTLKDGLAWGFGADRRKGDTFQGVTLIASPSIVVMVVMVPPPPIVVVAMMVIVVMDALKRRGRRACEVRNPRHRRGLRWSSHCEAEQGPAKG